MARVSATALAFGCLSEIPLPRSMLCAFALLAVVVAFPASSQPTRALDQEDSDAQSSPAPETGVADDDSMHCDAPPRSSVTSLGRKSASIPNSDRAGDQVQATSPKRARSTRRPAEGRPSTTTD